MARTPKVTQKHIDVARGVVQQDKSFYQSAVSAGYSTVTARKGQAVVRSEIPALNLAFIRESKRVEWTPTERKQIATHRIVSTCIDDRSTDNLKAAELIGKMKDVDMFVRNGDLQVGIFQQITSEDTSKELETITLPSLEDTEPK